MTPTFGPLGDDFFGVSSLVQILPVMMAGAKVVITRWNPQVSA
jgi:hypothetical protein